jgi:hypothetical protein
MVRRVRVLAVCNGGNVRSQAICRALRKRGFECLPGGVDDNDLDTLQMLWEWADVVFPQADSMRKLERKVKAAYESRELPTTREWAGLMSAVDMRFDLGYDDFYQPGHPLLVQILRAKLDEHHEFLEQLKAGHLVREGSVG